MVFSPWGEMFVTNFDGHSVSRFFFDSGGAALPNGTITGNDLASPVGMAFSPWGELFVGNTTNQKISRFTFSETGVATANGTIAMPGPVGTLQFVNASAPIVPPPCVPGVTTSVRDGLIGWWKGDGNAEDFTGNNNTTEENGVTYEAGRFGQAFLVGGSGPNPPLVNIGHLPQLRGATAYTVSAWMKLHNPVYTLSGQYIFLGLPVGNAPPAPPGVSYSANFRCFNLLNTVVSGPEANYTTCNFIAASTPLTYKAAAVSITPPGGAWVHLAGVWRSSDGFYALYVDGVLKKSGNAPPGAQFPEGTGELLPGYIGAFGSVSVAAGAAIVKGNVPQLWDDVRIYTRDLTADEIALIASGEDFNTCPPPNTGFPPLTAARVPAGVRVAWPSRFTGWALETSTDAINWTPVTGTPLLEASEFSLTTSASPVRKFFRLRRSGN